MLLKWKTRNANENENANLFFSMFFSFHFFFATLPKAFCAFCRHLSSSSSPNPYPYRSRSPIPLRDARVQVLQKFCEIYAIISLISLLLSSPISISVSMGCLAIKISTSLGCVFKPFLCAFTLVLRDLPWYKIYCIYTNVSQEVFQ